MKLQLLRHLPIRYQAAMGSAVIASVAFAMWLSLHNSSRQLERRQKELKALQSQIQEHKVTAYANTGDFTQTLPARSRSDNVVRDMSRFATSVGVEISSLNIQPQPATDRDLGRIQYHVRLNADYSATKTWLAELLARHSTLALQELSIHAVSSAPYRDDVSAALVLYVRE